MSEMLRTEIFVGTNKETMRDKGIELGLEGAALAMFMYACLEVVLDIVVEKDTGLASIVGVDGKALEAPRRGR